MDPMVALGWALLGTSAFVFLRITRSPPKFILQEPTTVWPVASFGAGIGLAVAVVLVVTVFASVWIALLLGLIIFFMTASIGSGTNLPKRITYDRGSRTILRTDLLLAIVLFGVILTFLSQ